MAQQSPAAKEKIATRVEAGHRSDVVYATEELKTAMNMHAKVVDLEDGATPSPTKPTPKKAEAAEVPRDGPAPNAPERKSAATAGKRRRVAELAAELF